MDTPFNERISVFFSGVEHSICFRKDRNARRLTLRVRPAKRDVLLSIPSHISEKRAIAFIDLNISWIHEKLGNLPPLIELAPGSIIPIRGEDHRIIHLPGARGTAWIDASNDEKTPALFVAGQAEYAKRRIRNFLIQLARLDLTKSVAHYSKELGRRPPKITLKDTSSRWGSCSSKGDLSFSWRLIFAPPMVLDYLSAHEVTHLLEMNHSKEFWNTVTRICRHSEEAELWLRENGSMLHAFK